MPNLLHIDSSVQGDRSVSRRLTAHAMEGDRERCLAAGMDDFLSKPFTQQQMATQLKRWLAVRAMPAQAERTDTSRAPLVDIGVLRNIAALARPALLNSLIDLYLQHSPILIAAIEAADDDLFLQEVKSAGGIRGPLGYVLNLVAVMHVAGHVDDIVGATG